MSNQNQNPGQQNQNPGQSPVSSRAVARSPDSNSRIRIVRVAATSRVRVAATSKAKAAVSSKPD